MSNVSCCHAFQIKIRIFLRPSCQTDKEYTHIHRAHFNFVDSRNKKRFAMISIDLIWMILDWLNDFNRRQYATIAIKLKHTHNHTFTFDKLCYRREKKEKNSWTGTSAYCYSFFACLCFFPSTSNRFNSMYMYVVCACVFMNHFGSNWISPIHGWISDMFVSMSNVSLCELSWIICDGKYFININVDCAMHMAYLCFLQIENFKGVFSSKHMTHGFHCVSLCA